MIQLWLSRQVEAVPTRVTFLNNVLTYIEVVKQYYFQTQNDDTFSIVQ